MLDIKIYSDIRPVLEYLFMQLWNFIKLYGTHLVKDCLVSYEFLYKP